MQTAANAASKPNNNVLVQQTYRQRGTVLQPMHLMPQGLRLP